MLSVVVCAALVIVQPQGARCVTTCVHCEVVGVGAASTGELEGCEEPYPPWATQSEAKRPKKKVEICMFEIL
jgi:hypothetical protein